MSIRRIAYLTSEYPAASHTFIRREVDALRARGLSIETFSIRRPQNSVRLAAPDAEARNTTTYLLPTSVWMLVKAHFASAVLHPIAYVATLRRAILHRVPGMRALVWSLFHFVEAIALAAMLRDAKIDHLHNHFANSSANVGLLTSNYLGITWSVTLHGTADWVYPAGYLLPEKIAEASFVACVSQFGRAQTYGICARDQWGKIFVARCGVDLSVFPRRQVASQSSGALRVLAVGRLSPEKGQHGLLQSFADLIGRGVDAQLQIIGDGPLRESLLKTVAALGLHDVCKLVGQKTEDEVLQALAEADLFVQSSLMEGLPVVLMEALGMHVPVIAPRVAGIPELVVDGETGLLFAAGDWNELTKQMERAARDPDLRSRLAQRGHELVVQQFEIKRAVEPLAQRFLNED